MATLPWQLTLCFMFFLQKGGNELFTQFKRKVNLLCAVR